MSDQRILDSLTALFANHGVVFWHDVDGEFSSAINSLHLEGVQVVRVDQMPALGVKIAIERFAGQRWLLYSNQAEPAPTEDWLLDVRLGPSPSAPTPRLSCSKTWA